MREKQIVELEGNSPCACTLGAIGAFLSMITFVVVLPVMVIGLGVLKIFEWWKGR